MAGIKDYSTTNSSNTTLNTISVAEGMLPSQLNNAIRALMVNTREWYNDAQWVIYGDGDGAYTATYVSGTSFTINGADVTSIYHEGRRIKITAATPGTIYGTISSSSFSTLMLPPEIAFTNSIIKKLVITQKAPTIPTPANWIKN